MTLRPRSAAAGLAAAALSTALLAAAPAHAEGDNTTDVTGDVAAFPVPDGKAPAGRLAAGPSRGTNPDRTLDITRLKTSYAKNTITFKTTVVQLAESGYQAIGLVKAGKREYFLRWDNQFEGDVSLFTSSGKPVDCPGAVAGANLAKSRITLTLPASCIKNPKKVKTGAQVGAFVDQPDPTPDEIHLDDARVDGPVGLESPATYGASLREN